MKKKIVATVGSCLECPHSAYSEFHIWNCMHGARSTKELNQKAVSIKFGPPISNPEVFPTWCPLEDYNESRIIVIRKDDKDDTCNNRREAVQD